VAPGLMPLFTPLQGGIDSGHLRWYLVHMVAKETHNKPTNVLDLKPYDILVGDAIVCHVGAKVDNDTKVLLTIRYPGYRIKQTLRVPQSKSFVVKGKYRYR
jgi:hypothetical protein